jgi:hypothetical protein
MQQWISRSVEECPRLLKRRIQTQAVWNHHNLFCLVSRNSLPGLTKAGHFCILATFRFLSLFQFSKVQSVFDNEGNPRDSKWNQWAQSYLEERSWFTGAMATQKRKGAPS